MTSPAAVASPPPLAPAALGAVPRWSLWSDRLNAILVREVQQAVKGRMFSLAIVIALTITVIIATTAVGRMGRSSPGRSVFDSGLATLVPLVLFVVPMQAFQSMRLELRGGIVEQLLLSRLRPRTILVGKLQAAMVQFVLFVAMMSPLLATSYLLHGVDLPTIFVSLGFALVFCLVATAFAVSSAAQGMTPAMQPIANLAVAMGLGIATFMTVGFVGSGQYARVIGWMWSGSNVLPWTTAILLLAAASTVMSLLIAQSHLLHAFENRSTGFRLMLFVCPALAFGWMMVFLPSARWHFAVPVLSNGMLLLGTAFAIFMVTEQRSLSVRVRAHVPRGALALLAAPFLPGRDRGLLCFCIYLALLAIGTWLLWPTGGGRSLLEPEQMFVVTSGYALVYLALLRWLRARLPETVGANHLGRFLVPLLLAGGCIVPLLVDLFVHGEVGSWHVGHVMNPFWTIAETMSLDRPAWRSVVPWIVFVAGIAVALQVPAMIVGVREVLRAALARRSASRSGAPPSGAPPSSVLPGNVPHNG